MRSLIFAAILLAAGDAIAAEATAPKDRQPPDYPAGCLPPSDREAIQKVTLVYRISEGRAARDIQAVKPADACLAETAAAAVRGWRFDDLAQNIRTYETTFTFAAAERAVDLQHHDVTPLLQVPPAYPERCMRDARSAETVLLLFDKRGDGSVENVRVVDSTSPCLNQAAVDSVAQWKYAPREENGQPVIRKDFETAVTFELSGGGTPDIGVRGRVLAAFVGAQWKAGNGRISEALDQLAETELDYGDSFSKSERRMFHQVRATVRIAANQIAGALGDLRLVKRHGAKGGDARKVDKVISQLEALLAAPPAAPPVPAGAAEPKPETE